MVQLLGFSWCWCSPRSPASLHCFSLPLCRVPSPPLFSPPPCSLVPRQSKVLVSVSVSAPDLFHVVLRYTNWGGSDVLGRVSVIEDGWNYYCGNCKCRASSSSFWPSVHHLPPPPLQRGHSAGLQAAPPHWKSSSSSFLFLSFIPAPCQHLVIS